MFAMGIGNGMQQYQLVGRAGVGMWHRRSSAWPGCARGL